MVLFLGLPSFYILFQAHLFLDFPLHLKMFLDWEQMTYGLGISDFQAQ